MKQQTRTRVKQEGCARFYDWEEGSNNGALGKKEAASGCEIVPRGRDSTAEAWLYTVGVADGGWARHGPGTTKLQELGFQERQMWRPDLSLFTNVINKRHVHKSHSNKDEPYIT